MYQSYALFAFKNVLFLLGEIRNLLEESDQSIFSEFSISDDADYGTKTDSEVTDENASYCNVTEPMDTENSNAVQINVSNVFEESNNFYDIDNEQEINKKYC